MESRSSGQDLTTFGTNAAVQDVVGSPGWIVIGDTGGGDQVAVDLTPGPGATSGQIIVLDHEQSVGGGLFAESLTDLVQDPERDAAIKVCADWDPRPTVALANEILGLWERPDLRDRRRRRPRPLP
ncbi:SMI1/KNR4 family protein [Streptomyces sp. CMB-StM0423]|uniref:SMI1/KNR4 family protein n=1 Tax=Streptomyces sp. CMB-StM0423 TaxID=2059884 RepID=UPI0026CD24C2